ncbi:MAG: S26 family signal peptidase [Thermoplasmata archaeon]
MSPRHDADDPDEEAEEERPRSRRPRPRPPRHRDSVRRWRDSDAEDDDEELEAPSRRGRLFNREKHPVYWRARDSLYFEPLVAVAIIVLVLVSLYAYTQNWPPVYVVESDSMQHGSSDVLGVINTGDLVLAQRLPAGQITPYVVGLQTDYSTYGEYGDVILYAANGVGATPIIHRALLYLEWDPANGGSYNATDLSGLRCGTAPGAVFATPGTKLGCGVTNLTGTIDLYDIGWRSVNVTLSLSPGLLGRHSGFVTMGDNNLAPEGCTSSCQSGVPDQVDGTSQLVETGWIVGVARGMLPWFGSIKLLLGGNAGEVPPQSWQFMGLTVAGIILLAFGIHYALRVEGIEDERRKEEEAAADEEEEPPPTGRGRRFLSAIHPWGRSEDEEEDIDDPPRPRPARSKPPTVLSRRRGRPSPKVRRAERAKHPASKNKDNDL